MKLQTKGSATLSYVLMMNIIFILCCISYGYSKKTLEDTRDQYKFLLCVKSKTKEYRSYIKDIDRMSFTIELLKLGLLTPQTAAVSTDLILVFQSLQDVRHVLFLTKININKYCPPLSSALDIKKLPYKGSLIKLYRDTEGIPIDNSAFKSIQFSSEVTGEKVIVEFNSKPGAVRSDVKEIIIKGSP